MIILLANSIEENENNGEIGAFQTLDPDPTHKHTYALVVNPGKHFIVRNSTLYTSATANLSYEAQQTWNITVRSEDNGIPPLSVKQQFTVVVLDVNEAPNHIRLSNNKVAEMSCFYSYMDF